MDRTCPPVSIHEFNIQANAFPQVASQTVLNEFDAKQRLGWFVSCIWHVGVFALVPFEWTWRKGRNYQVGKENNFWIFVFLHKINVIFLGGDNRLDLLFESTLWKVWANWFERQGFARFCATCLIWLTIVLTHMWHWTQFSIEHKNQTSNNKWIFIQDKK